MTANHREYKESILESEPRILELFQFVAQRVRDSVRPHPLVASDPALIAIRIFELCQEKETESHADPITARFIRNNLLNFTSIAPQDISLSRHAERLENGGRISAEREGRTRIFATTETGRQRIAQLLEIMESQSQ